MNVDNYSVWSLGPSSWTELFICLAEVVGAEVTPKGPARADFFRDGVRLSLFMIRLNGRFELERGLPAWLRQHSYSKPFPLNKLMGGSWKRGRFTVATLHVAEPKGARLPFYLESKSWGLALTEYRGGLSELMVVPSGNEVWRVRIALAECMRWAFSELARYKYMPDRVS